MNTKAIRAEISQLSAKLQSKTAQEREVRMVVQGVELENGSTVEFNVNRQQLLYQVRRKDQDASGREVWILRLLNKTRAR